MTQARSTTEAEVLLRRFPLGQESGRRRERIPVEDRDRDAVERLVGRVCHYRADHLAVRSARNTGGHLQPVCAARPIRGAVARPASKSLGQPIGDGGFLVGREVSATGRFDHLGGLSHWARELIGDRRARSFDGGDGFSPRTVVVEVRNALLRESRLRFHHLQLYGTDARSPRDLFSTRHRPKGART